MCQMPALDVHLQALMQSCVSQGRRTRAKKAKKDSLQLAMIDEIEEHCQPVCLANIELAEKGEAKQAVLPEGEPPCLQIEAQSDDRGGPARDEEDPEKENVQPQIEFLGSSKALAGHQDAPVPEIAAVSDPNRRCSNHLSPEAAVQQTDRGATDDSPDNVAREEASGSLHTAGAQVEGPPPDAAEASAVHNDLTEYFTPAQAELPRASPKSRPTTRSRYRSFHSTCCSFNLLYIAVRKGGCSPNQIVLYHYHDPKGGELQRLQELLTVDTSSCASVKSSH